MCLAQPFHILGDGASTTAVFAVDLSCIKYAPCPKDIGLHRLQLA